MKLTKLLLLAFVSLSSVSLASCNKNKDKQYEGTDPATILNGYYKDLESWDNYIDLRQKLYNIISKDFEAIPYVDTLNDDGTVTKGKSNWNTNRHADQSLYNYDNVHVLYSDNEESKFLGESATWQREHCFPASLMTGKSTGDAVKTIGTATDFHNLYASYATGNSTHSNNSFGNVDESIQDRVPIKTVGNARYQDDDPSTTVNETVFEPADIDKGRVARAVFYIGLMYGKDSWVKKEDSKGHELSTGIEIVTRESKIPCTLQSAQQGLYKCHSNSEDLVDWCRKFWPDRLEYQHTTYVQSVQHNRNPFVDFPELVEYVYGDLRTEPGELKNLHNIYDILDLGNDNVNNVAIKNVRHSYDAGDTYDASKDLEVYAVKNDMTAERLDTFGVKGVSNGQTLDASQNGKYISITSGDAKPAVYPIYVASPAWKEVNYVGLPTYDLVKQKSKPEIVNLNGVSWSFDSSAKSTEILEERREPIGVSIGSGSSRLVAVPLQLEHLTSRQLMSLHMMRKQLLKASMSKLILLEAIMVHSQFKLNWVDNFSTHIMLNIHVTLRSNHLELLLAQ